MYVYEFVNFSNILFHQFLFPFNIYKDYTTHEQITLFENAQKCLRCCQT